MKALVIVLMLCLGGLAVYPMLSRDAGSPDPTDPGAKVVLVDRPGGSPPSTSTAPGPGPSEGTVVPTGPAVRRPGVIQDDPVADVAYGLIETLSSGPADETRRRELETWLVDILREQKVGANDADRADAAALTVNTVVRNIAGRTTASATEFQRLAMKTLADEVAADLYRRLSPRGGSGRHDGSVVSSAIQAEIPAPYRAVGWGTIGGFEYREGMTLPREVLDLNGQKVGFAGYMMTLEEVEDIHEFVLVESLWTCCFGVVPDVNQVLLVTLKSEKGIDYTTAPLVVLGDMEVGEEKMDGFVTSLYRIKADRATPAH